MKEYFASVMAITFIGGIVVSLAPEGASQRYLRLLVGLAVTGCIITPIFSFFGDNVLHSDLEYELPEVENDALNYEEIYNNSIISAGVSEAEQVLENEILQALNGKCGSIDVVINACEKSGEIYIDSVQLLIYPSGIALDPHFMQKHISERLGRECEVIYVSEQ